MQPDLSAVTGSSLFIFTIGYVLCLMTPGPNFVVIAGVSLVRGLGGAMPICFGVAWGSIALGLGVAAAASLVPSGEAWQRAARIVAGLLLLYVAWRLVRAESPIAARADGHADFGLGFATALVNPITGAYFASQFLAMRQSGQTSDYVAELGLIWGIALLRSVAIAAIFGSLLSNEYRWAASMRLTQAAGALFAAIAVWQLATAMWG